MNKVNESTQKKAGRLPGDQPDSCEEPGERRGKVPHGERPVRTGQWLFRWRSYPPLVLFAIILPAFKDYSYLFGSSSYELAWQVFCFAISLLGLGIRSYTVGRTPKGTSGRNTRKQRADQLNTTGAYSISRNPLYVGNFLMMLGPNMFVRVWWVSVIYTLAFWLYYERIILAEEAFLKKKFGKEYDDYFDRTPAFLPDFSLWQPPDLSFSLRNVLRREHSGFLSVVILFLILSTVGHYVVEGTFMLHPVWLTFFFIGVVEYVVLRTLKKRTRLLHVDGR